MVESLAQISGRGCAILFETAGRRIIRIGLNLNFDRQTRNIGQWLAG